MARRRALGESVIFTGSVPWDDVPAYTDAGDVFAMPCRTRLFGLEPEAFGIVFLEAQACGLPVVAGDSGGATEAVRPANSVVVRAEVGPVGRAVVERLSVRSGKSMSEGRGVTWVVAVERLRGMIEG